MRLDPSRSGGSHLWEPEALRIPVAPPEPRSEPEGRESGEPADDEGEDESRGGCVITIDIS